MIFVGFPEPVNYFRACSKVSITALEETAASGKVVTCPAASRVGAFKVWPLESSKLTEFGLRGLGA